MDLLGVKLVDDRVGHARVAADYGGGVLWPGLEKERATYIHSQDTIAEYRSIHLLTHSLDM